MSNQSLLDETARLDRAVVQVYRYGMLALILGLLALEALFYLYGPPGRDPYEGFILPLMLLFGHLALAFKWPRRITIALYVLSFGWMVFGLFYDFYLSGVLYPVHLPGGN